MRYQPPRVTCAALLLFIYLLATTSLAQTQDPQQSTTPDPDATAQTDTTDPDRLALSGDTDSPDLPGFFLGSIDTEQYLRMRNSHTRRLRGLMDPDFDPARRNGAISDMEQREQELREQLYGSYVGWHGSFNPDAPKSNVTWPPPGGYPKVKPRPGRAADFIAETIHAHPNEVVLYCAGPLTNIAVAITLDPAIVPLTKAIYIMGGSSAGGPELNWWWDPEAAAMVLRAPWQQIVVSPFEAGEQVVSNQQLMRRIVEKHAPLSDYVNDVYLTTKPTAGTTIWSLMWDELTVASILDPGVIRKSETMYLDVDITHGPKYGHTVVWKKPSDVPQFMMPYSSPDGPDREKWLSHLTPPSQLHPASVQMEVDVKRFEDDFVEMMSQ